jgi:hypothetical protein
MFDLNLFLLHPVCPFCHNRPAFGGSTETLSRRLFRTRICIPRGVVPDVAGLNEGTSPDYVVFAHYHVNMSDTVVTVPAFRLL